MIPMLIVLHDPKSHAVPHVDYLDLTNVMVILTVPRISCDTDAGANGVT